MVSWEQQYNAGVETTIDWLSDMHLKHTYNLLWSLSLQTLDYTCRIEINWPVSRVPQCACWMTCSASSGAEVCTFLFWMVHCGMPGRCAVGWVRLVYHYYCLTDLSKLLCGTYDVEICFMLYLYLYVFMLYLCHVTVLWNAYLFGPKWSINYYY